MTGPVLRDGAIIDPAAAGKPASPEGKPTVTVLDYGSGNVRSAVRALERAGAEVILSSKPEDVLNADGLVVPGVGAFETVMRELKAVDAIRMIGRRVAGGRPVLAICVGPPGAVRGRRRTRHRSRRHGGVARQGGTAARRRRARTWAGTPSPSRKAPGSSPASRTSASTSCTPTASSTGTSTSSSRGWRRRSSPGPSTAPRSSRPWKTARCAPPSSTRRSPATPARGCCATGSTACAAARRRTEPPAPERTA